MLCGLTGEDWNKACNFQHTLFLLRGYSVTTATKNNVKDNYTLLDSFEQEQDKFSATS